MVRRLKWGLLLSALIVAASVFGSSARATSIIVVDDDHAECPAATETTIAGAIATASAGDTILVCPGDYSSEGTILVGKALSLVGYTPRFASLSACADEAGHPATQTTMDSIVAGFQVGANFVSIRGFTITGAADGVLIPGNVSRATVSRNVLQQNSIGINLNGSHNEADHNCIRNPVGPDWTGIYSDQGLRSTTIDNNLFVNNRDLSVHEGTGAAITLTDDGVTPGTLDDVHVVVNSSMNDGDLISIAGSTRSEISGNTSKAADGSAIFLEESGGTNEPNSQLRIENNTLKNGGDEGIYASPSSLVDSSISGNTVTKNATYGLHIDTGNSGNAVKNNNFKGNHNSGATFDCADDSFPDNTWKKDKGNTPRPRVSARSSAGRYPNRGIFQALGAATSIIFA